MPRNGRKKRDECIAVGQRMNEKRKCGVVVGVRRETLAPNSAWVCKIWLWPLRVSVIQLNEEILGAELELKQMKILLGFGHLFCTYD